jgi:hypothetical protein
VTFAPADDPNLTKVKSGERSEEESCALGCEENPAVTVERAACLEDIDVEAPEVCQPKVAECLGVE